MTESVFSKFCAKPSGFIVQVHQFSKHSLNELPSSLTGHPVFKWGQKQSLPQVCDVTGLK